MQLNFVHTLIYWATSSMFTNPLPVNPLNKLALFLFYFTIIAPSPRSALPITLHDPSTRGANDTNVSIGFSILANTEGGASGIDTGVVQ